MDVKDQDLLEAARRGDREALEALLLRHQDSLYRFSSRMCRDLEDAKDVLQETLLAMARGVGGFRGGSSLSTWAYTIARRFCAKKRHGDKKFAGDPAFRSQPESERSVAEPAPEDALANRELRMELDSAIRSLAPAYREVFLLRDGEGMTAPQVASTLGLSVDAVKSRLHRARLAVRERLAPLLMKDVDRRARSVDCRELPKLFSRHLEGDINSEVCAKMEKHLATCRRCQQECDSLKNTLALCRATGRGEVPPAVQESVRTALHRFLNAVK